MKFDDVLINIAELNFMKFWTLRGYDFGEHLCKGVPEAVWMVWFGSAWWFLGWDAWRMSRFSFSETLGFNFFQIYFSVGKHSFHWNILGSTNFSSAGVPKIVVQNCQKIQQKLQHTILLVKNWSNVPISPQLTNYVTSYKILLTIPLVQLCRTYPPFLF